MAYVTDLSQSAFLRSDFVIDFLRNRGLIYDPTLIKNKAQKTRDYAIEEAKRLGRPGLAGGATDKGETGDRRIIVNGKSFYLRDFVRDKNGNFVTKSSEFTRGGYSDETSANVNNAILAEREELIKSGKLKLGADNAEQFDGLSLLQREALIDYTTRDILGTANSLKHFGPMLSDPEKYANASKYDKARIKSFLNEKTVQAMIKERRTAFPNSYLGMNTGTLGTLGTLFANFGKGTRATLHGKEAVVTPKQLQNVIGAGTQISVKDVVNRLNNNISLMISVAKEDVRLERSKLMAMT
jgi:hypothetical protein